MIHASGEATSCERFSLNEFHAKFFSIFEANRCDDGAEKVLKKIYLLENREEENR